MQHKIKTITIIFYLSGTIFCTHLHTKHENNNAMYFATAADACYFPHLLNLIGSIHRVNFDELNEIAVFDLGVTKSQRQILEQIQKVNVYDVEITHPDLLTPFTDPGKPNRPRRGWYAWKPVVIKQALNMFPYVLYLDAGTLILNPLNDLFEHFRQHGYFFLSCMHNIVWMTTQYVIYKFHLQSPERKWILSKYRHGIAAGFQGLTKNLYKDYVLPMYELSKDIRYFADDGTAPGKARHDQTLSSIYIRILGLEIHKRKGGKGLVNLSLNNKIIPFYITPHVSGINEQTHIFLQVTRKKHPNYLTQIRYKSNGEKLQINKVKNDLPSAIFT